MNLWRVPLTPTLSPQAGRGRIDPSLLRLNLNSSSSGEGGWPQAPACAVPPSLSLKGGGNRESRALSVPSIRKIIISPLAEQRGGGLQHLVGGADHLGVHLVGALRRDQVGNLGDDLDIGLLEIALLHVAKTVGVGDAVLRRARR